MKINPNAQLKIQLGSDGNPKIYACGTQNLRLRHTDGTSGSLHRIGRGNLYGQQRPSRDNHQHHDSCR